MAELNVTDRDGVRWIELCRPGSKNALTLELNKAIIDALREISGRPELRAAVVSGGGGDFCSGLDLRAAMQRGPRSPEQTESEVREYFHGLILAVRAVDVPVIAAIDGVAAGFGCDLALACDLRIVTDRARFAELFVRRGLMPDGGGTFTLPRLVGVGRALEIMLTGDAVDGAEAVRIGLANRLVPSAELSQAVWELAARLAKGPPLVHRAIKRSVYASLSGDLEAALERELTNQLELLRSADFFEGVAAFLHKREPSFHGK